jgi:SAM-dependent methyltransferase
LEKNTPHAGKRLEQKPEQTFRLAVLDNEYIRLDAVEDNLWWFRAMRLFISRVLPAEALNAQKILDLGCGTGGLLSTLRNQAGCPVGLDYSGLALSLAQRRGNRELIRASANEVPFTNAFDTVVSVDILEVGTVDPSKVIETTMNAIKPGGYALFVMAAHQWLLSEHDRAVNSVRRFNVAQMKALFHKPQLEIVRAGYFYLLLFPIMALRKLLNSKGAGDVSSDVSQVPAIINEPLFWICWLEAQMTKFFDLPIGTSVYVLVKKHG